MNYGVRRATPETSPSRRIVQPALRSNEPLDATQQTLDIVVRAVHRNAGAQQPAAFREPQ